MAIKKLGAVGLNSLPEKDAAREFLYEVLETSSLALEEAREIAHNLRLYQLERLDLTDALEHMLKNIKTPVQISGEIENIDNLLSKGLEIVFYRIARQCLNNVIKHSAAQNVRMFVQRNNGNLKLICRDDGRGYDFAPANMPETAEFYTGHDQNDAATVASKRLCSVKKYQPKTSKFAHCFQFLSDDQSVVSEDAMKII